MSDIEKGLLGEIYELIDAMTKAEANFSQEKRIFFVGCSII